MSNIPAWECADCGTHEGGTVVVFRRYSKYHMKGVALCYQCFSKELQTPKESPTQSDNRFSPVEEDLH